jgi:hypothetical protein
MERTQSSTLVYRGKGRKLCVKKSIDERIIDKYIALTGSVRQAKLMYKEFKMHMELSMLGRGLAS